MADRTLGGRERDPALAIGGNVYTYAELANAIEDYARHHEPDSGATIACYDASELPLDQALICVCAAARSGIPVRVEDPTARPDRGAEPRWAAAALLVATSGSTGHPRPLARTAASWYDSFPTFTARTGIEAIDTVLITGPAHATMHLFGALHALWVGACVTDDPERATVVHAVPAVLRGVLDQAPKLRLAVVAGIALDAGAAAAAEGIEVVEYYGSAEVSLVATRRVPQPLRLIEGVEARVRDGLLEVRSPYVVLGAPEWFAVGDLARLGEGGELTIFGRGNCAINVGGVTVLAEDVERVLRGIDGVRAVGVLGTSHAVLGETVTAAVELDGTTVAQVKARARGLLSKEAMPRRWVELGELPRTTTGKVARARLRELVA